jgi:hypothetical protein
MYHIHSTKGQNSKDTKEMSKDYPKIRFKGCIRYEYEDNELESYLHRH